ncbi:MAG: NifB/NifX family molybdenum-iron cluster-binding protein [Deltaproteobacteria bacterium]|nr:NifB/NifX family molybdenum-iron cluster-binding protein [Deltaproteobacteria bacterium]
MKIAFAFEDKGIESSLGYHFGRCRYYVFVEIKNGDIKEVETKENPFFNNHEPGLVPQFIAREGADVVIAGGMGPRAIEWFEKLKVRPIAGASGDIKHILDDYLLGKLTDVKPCNEHRGR